MFRKFILLIVSSVAIFSTAVVAVGLGKSELMSGLNQPLKAQIKLLSAEELAEHELKVSLASAQEFDKVGVERLFFLNNIKFKIVRDSKGKLIVNLTSHDTIKEPFLNFVIALNYPTGRLVKEYTFLMDPPVFEESTSSTIERSQSSTISQSQKKQNSNRTNQANQVSPVNAVTTSQTGMTYGAVSSTDTLWGIAQKTRPNSQVSIQQTLVAIYRANPHAFANGNINNLLRGEVLQIPDVDTINRVPHRAALQDVVMQNKQWQTGGARKIVDNQQKTSKPNTTTSEARLSLATQDNVDSSDAQSGGSSTNSRLSEAQGALALSQEKSATLQAENEELRSRLADLLEEIESAKADAALNISDTELTALTQQQNNDEFDEVDSEESNEENITDNEDVLDDSELVDAELNSSEPDSVDDTPAETVADSSEVPDDKAQAEGNKKDSLPIVIATKKETSLIDSLFDSGLLLAGIIAVILLVIIGVFWRMRKRMEEDDFQDDLVASAGAGLMDTTETFELPDVGDDMLDELDMDDAESGGRGGSDDETFDPLGEADIYIAYGKFEQAESLLLESIEDNPIRSDLKVKLMECYAENENKDKFDSIADEVSRAVDAEEWLAKINEMRQQAWSEDGEDSSFDLPSTEDIFGDDDADFGSDLDSTPSDTSGDFDEHDFNLEEDDDSDEFSLDDLDDDESDNEFSLDADDLIETELDETDNEFDIADEDEFDLDMDMDDDLGIDEKVSSEANIAASDAVTETFDALDDDDSFSLDDDEDELPIMEEELALDDEDELELDVEDDLMMDLDDSSLDLDDDNFDIDDDDSNFDSEESSDLEDEISTKLDLARAYIDMGDSDGAKEILTEVLADGSEQQIKEAQALIDKAD